MPKGRGLVETALDAGIEIPVFCYEPRLGAAVRRVPDVPRRGRGHAEAPGRLHDDRAGRDGGQDRARPRRRPPRARTPTLEFILVNHPLDCPVCDKGGECPLQDLTFRYGPGSTRMTFPKIDRSRSRSRSRPTIALDRERCILCYRCTRFCEGVAEDNQLVAVNRGAGTLIDTFADDPYRAPFSGNVIELCPVGALTSTLYRFEARPLGDPERPDRLRALPGRLQRHAPRPARARSSASSRGTTPRSTRAGSATRAASPTRTCAASDRIVDPLRRAGAAGFEPVSWDDALDEAERLLRAAGGQHRDRALRLGDGRAGVRARQAAPAGPRRARRRAARGDRRRARRVPRCRCRRSRDAELVVVLGDDPVVERAPIVDLWIRAARRARRRGGHRSAPRGRCRTARARPRGACADLASKESELGERLRTSERVVLVWSGPGGHGGAQLAALAHALELAQEAALRRVPPARDPERARRRRRRGRPRPTRRPPIRSRIGLLIVSGDEAAADPSVRALAERAETRARDHDVPRARGRLGRPRAAGDELPRARRHDGQPRGTAAAAAARRDPARAGRARVDRQARRAVRGRALAVPVASSSTSCRESRRTAGSRSPTSASTPRCRRA